MTELAFAESPRRHPGVELRREADRCVLVDASGDEVCAMNDTAAAIWELCDGLTTLAEMVDAVCTISHSEPEAVAHDIQRVMRKLGRLGVIDLVGAEGVE